MKLLIVLCLVAALAAEDLNSILRSPVLSLKLYNNFKSGEGLNFRNSGEDRMRFRLFLNNAQFVASANNEADDSVTFGLNQFSTMTDAEKGSYLGINATGISAHAPLLQVSDVPVPAEKLWTDGYLVTKVKNQGSCGSCWTFAAVGGLETRYAVHSGVLKSFAEQEFLDCVYSYRDGCRGGWPGTAYDWSAANGGRLATARNYPYQGYASYSRCGATTKANGLIAASLARNIDIPAGEANNIQALAAGSVSMAFEVTSYFYQYAGGILKDPTCTGAINHGVTGVGYTPDYVLVKNSWGKRWGELGFIKFARNHGNCRLFDFSSYPQLTDLGVVDTDPKDMYSPYKPRKYTPQPGPDGSCPNGTIMCPDGKCRHEHMC